MKLPDAIPTSLCEPPKKKKEEEESSDLTPMRVNRGDVSRPVNHTIPSRQELKD